jgi:NTE family protein
MQYSPSRRTALVFCGTGAHGAYHAGVLRALQEAGVKVDVAAGQGIGAAAAVLAAIDGASRSGDRRRRGASIVSPRSDGSGERGA